jgi:hypothetical protein
VKRNITVAIDEDLARWARVRAAQCDKSVSQLVADILRSEMEEVAQTERGRYKEWWEKFSSFEPRPLSNGEPYPTRDDLYDRPVLRRHERPGL